MIYSLRAIRFFLRSIAPCLLLLAGSADILLAQIEVSPVRVLLTSRQRDIEVFVSNPLDEAVEVETRFGFKVLRSDSLGNRTLDTVASAGEMANSCRNWLKLYPQKLTLPPRSTRSVRIIATPPEAIADGEYWARLELIGEKVGRAKPVTVDTNGISVDLKMRLNVGIPITYRKGQVETGVAISNVQARRVDTNLMVMIDTRRLGNAAYRGTLKAVLRGADGSDLAAREDEFTNEHELRNVLNFTNVPLPEGRYKLDIESRSVRTGTVSEMVLAAPPVTRSYSLLVSGSEIRVEGGE